MKNKKSFWISLLALILVCIGLQAGTVYAASLSASADAASVSQGDYVTISINLSGNPSFSTLGMALSYDSSILQYDSTSWSGGFSGGDMTMASDTGSEVNLSAVCEDSYADDGIVASVRFLAVADVSSIPVTLSLRDMAVSRCMTAVWHQASRHRNKRRAAVKRKNLDQTQKEPDQK